MIDVKIYNNYATKSNDTIKVRKLGDDVEVVEDDIIRGLEYNNTSSTTTTTTSNELKTLSGSNGTMTFSVSTDGYPQIKYYDKDNQLMYTIGQNGLEWDVNYNKGTFTPINYYYLGDSGIFSSDIQDLLVSPSSVSDTFKDELLQVLYQYNSPTKIDENGNKVFIGDDLVLVETLNGCYFIFNYFDNNNPYVVTCKVNTSKVVDDNIKEKFRCDEPTRDSEGTLNFTIYNGSSPDDEEMWDVIIKDFIYNNDSFFSKFEYNILQPGESQTITIPADEYTYNGDEEINYWKVVTNYGTQGNYNDISQQSQSEILYEEDSTSNTISLQSDDEMETDTDYDYDYFDTESESEGTTTLTQFNILQGVGGLAKGYYVKVDDLKDISSSEYNTIYYFRGTQDVGTATNWDSIPDEIHFYGDKTMVRHNTNVRE